MSKTTFRQQLSELKARYDQISTDLESVRIEIAKACVDDLNALFPGHQFNIYVGFNTSCSEEPEIETADEPIISIDNVDDAIYCSDGSGSFVFVLDERGLAKLGKTPHSSQIELIEAPIEYRELVKAARELSAKYGIEMTVRTDDPKRYSDPQGYNQR